MLNKKYSVNIQQVLLLVLLLSFAFSACTKQSATPTLPLQDKIDTTATLQFQGKFINGPFGLVTGEASIYAENGKFTLLLNNIDASNGPDLHVYLSKEINPKSFIDLGKLKSTKGNQSYDITGMPSFMDYKYALIHCQQFDHLFGSAALQ